MFAPTHVAADALAWSQAERGSFVTVVAKIAFAWRHGRTCALADRQPLCVRERHRDRTPAKSLEAADELVPWLPKPELLLCGSAFVSGGKQAPALTVQIALSRGGPAFKKRLEIYGDARPTGERQPFSRMPLIWERALRSDDNLVGVDVTRGAPNILDPARPTVSACFAPISSLWRPRRERLGDRPRPKLTREPVELPRGFEGTYFQAAPKDQWLDQLVGDEWLALDGLCPSQARLVTRLPGVRLAAKLVDQSQDVRRLALSPDRLALDSDLQSGTLTYRAVIPYDHDALADLSIFVGAGVDEQALVWPDAADPAARCGHLGAVPTSPTAEPIVDVDEPTNVRDVAPVGAPEASPLPDLEEVNEELIATRAMRPARVAVETPPEVRNTPGPDEALDDTRAMRPVSRAPRPLIPNSEESTKTHVAAQLDREAQTVLPSTPGSERGAAPSSSNEPSGSGDRLRGAVPPKAADATTPRRGAFDADERTALVVANRSDVPLPFGPAGTRPAVPGPAPAAPPEFPKAGEPSGLWIRPAAPRRRAPSAAPSAHRTADAVPREPPGKDRDARRRTEQLHVLTDTSVSVATVAWQLLPPQDSLTVIVKASFDLKPSGPARLRDTPELPLGDMFAEDDPEGCLLRASDFAILKPAVDVLVRGHAYAPNGRATVTEATLRLSGLERTITVLGDRHWEATGPSAPAPFEKIPIDRRRSFGGPGVVDNPVGTGRGDTPLPNFEDPSQPMLSPNDTPHPVGLGPIPPTADARWRMIGTYDTRWFETRWPYFPDDFDYHFFQAAPPEQQLPRLVGDESYSLTGLHRSGKPVVGSLPGQRAHAFACQADGVLTEIALRLDTVTFDTDESAVHLVWRGLIDVSDEDASEISELFVTLAPIAGAALTDEETRARYAVAHAAPRSADAAAPPRCVALEQRIAAAEASVVGELAAAEAASADQATKSSHDASVDRPREAGTFEDEPK